MTGGKIFAVIMGLGILTAVSLRALSDGAAPAVTTETAVATQPLAVEEYRDAAGEWRWRVRAANGHIICAASEGYQRRGTMQRVRDITFLKLATDNFKIVEVAK